MHTNNCSCLLWVAVAHVLNVQTWATTDPELFVQIARIYWRWWWAFFLHISFWYWRLWSYVYCKWAKSKTGLLCWCMQAVQVSWNSRDPCLPHGQESSTLLLRPSLYFSFCVYQDYLSRMKLVVLAVFSTLAFHTGTKYKLILQGLGVGTGLWSITWHKKQKNRKITERYSF